MDNIMPFSDVFRRMDNLMKTVEKFENSLYTDKFFAVPQKLASALPKMNIKDLGDKFIVEAAVPGILKENIEIEVVDNILRIASKIEEKKEVVNEDKGYIFKELTSRAFNRAIPLPEKVMEDSVKAELKDGLLTISIPKSEPKKIKSKRIEIQ